MILDMKVRDCHLDSRYAHLQNSNYRHYLGKAAEAFPILRNKVPIRAEYTFHHEIPEASEIRISSSIMPAGDMHRLCQSISMDGLKTTSSETIYAIGSSNGFAFEKLVEQALVCMQDKAGLHHSILEKSGLGLFIYSGVYEGNVDGATHIQTVFSPGKVTHSMDHLIYSGDEIKASARTGHVFVDLATRSFTRGPGLKRAENIFKLNGCAQAYALRS